MPRVGPRVPGWECAAAALRSRGGGAARAPDGRGAQGLAAGLPPYCSSRSQLLPPENQRATTRTSPAKAKTIKKYLGKDFEVLASYGHVRDLVAKEGAVDPTRNFAMKYEVIKEKNKDRHVDAINEPNRPIPSGRVPGRWGLYIAIGWTGLSLLVATLLGPWGFGAAVIGLALAWAYSAPPIRLKRNGWWGNAACGLCYEGLAWVTGAIVMAGGDLPDGRSLALAALYSLGAHGIMTLNDFKAIDGGTCQIDHIRLPARGELEGQLAFARHHLGLLEVHHPVAFLAQQQLLIRLEVAVRRHLLRRREVSHGVFAAGIR